MTTVYRAKKILTMDHNKPVATHVAIRDGVIVGVGGPDCAEGWGAITEDDRFADYVILPGLIEAHAHVSTGGLWRFTYCGRYLRTDPDGVDWPGVADEDSLIERLRDIADRTSEGEPIYGWGYDPGSAEGRRLDRELLDLVYQKHPIGVRHSSGHVLTVNSLALERAKINRDTNIEGIIRRNDGEPNGELKSFAAMKAVLQAVDFGTANLADAAAVKAYGKVARGCGVTTVADLYSDLHDEEVSMLEKVTGDPAFPVRYVPIMNAMTGEPEYEAERAVALRARSTEKLHLGRAKLFTDGSIQAGTAKLKAPGYFAMEDRGVWNMEVESFRAAVRALHRAGVKTHIHTNGDAASELAIDAIADAMHETPNADLRHTLEHAQLATIDQFKRMRALGITVNLFANHLHYFGDIHWTKSVGPDRAARMNACADAWSVWDGDFAIHSDAPVTPMSPLITAWCAVNRTTVQGRVLGQSQQLTVAQALHCITLGAAYVLKMDDQVGSIQCGKRADFCVLDRDPTEVNPKRLREVQPVATVLSGEVTACFK